ncbi:MAG: DUF1559 domain-containing protein [Planctomycetota bacterium]
MGAQTSVVLGGPTLTGYIWAPPFCTINGYLQAESIGSSFHPRGARFAFADGSMQFLSDNIAFETFVDSTAMADGNIVSGF